MLYTHDMTNPTIIYLIPYRNHFSVDDTIFLIYIFDPENMKKTPSKVAIFLVLVFPLILEEVALVFLLTALTVDINVKAKPEANLKRRFNLSLMP